ncbi:MAG TPA: hypothetical protein VKG01_20870 [Thermoanaerobaculia bacterium]|nr:hypothetical protein [Thermoanaerobaculia bacterium]
MSLAASIRATVGTRITRRLSELSARTKRLLYWSLFGVESAGMLGILWIALPLYQKLLSGPAGYRPGRALLPPILAITIVMQLSYWGKRLIRPPLRRGDRTVLGHMLLFLARLSFIFAGANLSLLLFRRFPESNPSPLGVVTLFVASFAQFCYVRELEALARIVEGGSTGEQARTVAG